MRKFGLVVFWVASLYMLFMIFSVAFVKSGYVGYLDAQLLFYPFHLLNVWFGLDIGLEGAILTVVGVQLVGLAFLSIAYTFERGSSVNK